MAEVAEAQAGEPGVTGGGEPDPVPEVAGLDRYAGRGGEHEGVVPPLGEALEVAVQLGGDRCGQGDQPAPGSALGGALDDFSGCEAQPLAPDGDDTRGEVDVATTEGEQLAAAEAAEAGDEHHGPVAVRDGAGQAVQLLHGGEPLLGVALGSPAFDPAGVLGDTVVIDGLAHDLAQPDVGLGSDRWALGFAQRCVPRPDEFGGDGRQRPPTERWQRRGDGRQDVEAELGGVDLPRAGSEIDPGSKPVGCVLAEGDLGRLGIDPQSSLLVGLGRRRSGGRVGLGGEGLRRRDHATVETAVAGLPSP